MTTPRIFRLAAGALMAWTFAAAALADGDVVVSEPITQPGWLNQGSLSCGEEACGPAATVNALLALQNLQPALYANPPLVGGAPADWKSLGDSLVSAAGCGCIPNDPGTPNNRLRLALLAYLKGFQPYQPSLETKGSPSLDWLGQQLSRKQGVVVLLNWTEDGKDAGHYVTLTGINTRTGQISIVDPATGGSGTGSLVAYAPGDKVYVSLPAAGGYEAIDDASISYAMAISPPSVPEPGAWLLLMVGVAGTGAALRRRRTPAPIAA